MKERHQQERKKLYMLKLSIFGLRIYLCNMSMKPYLRQLDNRCAHLRRDTKEKILNRAGGKCEHCGKELTLQTMQMHHVVPPVWTAQIIPSISCAYARSATTSFTAIQCSTTSL